ncbi:MAG: DUF2339 domain-containing protein, partial [Vicinamibacteria bacterium]|nr:DUF2339 domain-containing protein [Vicinamibacteria bacterium]
MLLALFAFAVTFLAIIRAGVLSAQVRKLRDERDELLITMEAQRRQIEEMRTPGKGNATEPLLTAAPAPPVPMAEVEDGGRSDVEIQAAPPSVLPVGATDPSASTALSSPPEVTTEPTSPPTDWESFIGVKGAAWMSGIAFILSAIFFARWIIEQGLIGPEVGFAVMLAVGIGALVSAEASMRQGLATIASPVSSAGLAILWVALLGAHARYALISMPAAFTGILAVTATGGLLAVRYRAFATAVLSLLVGFATSIGLAAREEATLGVFAYTLALNLGTLAVAVKGRWFGLLGLGLALTLVHQIRWFWNFMSPETMPVAIVIFLVFGTFYLVLPIAAGDADDPRLRRVSAIGGLVPFLFAFALATSKRYIDQWPQFFGLIAMLDAAILIVAVLFRRGALLRGAAIGTTLTIAWWALQGLKADSGASLFGSTLFAILIVSIFGFAQRIARVFGQADVEELRVLESAALAAGAGLVLFGTIMVGYGRGAPVGP